MSKSLEQKKAFFAEYEALCRKHGLCFGHEDEHGAFIVEDLRESLIEWARAGIDYSEFKDQEKGKES